ncbi:hypothetical protein [Murinocardiopsis flavida]|uniref:hypothetical protein n=1 Tax=Murinocardiopsis flavida TaxID=645275 RepID=UPI0014754303|nr:hypothetical protein [Murinocardiopsis flavida]
MSAEKRAQQRVLLRGELDGGPDLQGAAGRRHPEMGADPALFDWITRRAAERAGH